ncbi:uncharacterized protein LOC105789513 [Gossypium raimondii]|uniref:uncharacterized protein LOC105789513 n=1 Tax=Gossypium raimondii TaxID=29730 RepID=UPI00063AED0C|nr:uncharacterized protein LOC105789513 [Gossypium raimondii]
MEEGINEMPDRFTHIINGLKAIGKIYPNNEMINYNAKEIKGIPKKVGVALKSKTFEKNEELLEYEREFLRLSKYARECILTKVAMCTRLEDGLNEDVKLLVGILELKEFVVLVDRAQKAEKLSKVKRKVDTEARDSRKVTYWKIILILKEGSCFKCGSFEHYLRDCLERTDKEKTQTTRPSNTTAKGRPPRNTGNTGNSRSGTKDPTVRSEARTPTRAYVICAREEASTLDMITGTFSIFDTNVNASIHPGSTHSYVYTTLVSDKELPFESIEFVVKVTNPLGQYVLVDKVCKNCLLMIQACKFPVDLM